MDTIHEEPASLITVEEPSRVLENKHLKNQTMKNQRFKDAVNVEFSNCTFNSVVFQSLSRCSFTKCEFSGCTFHRNLTNVKFVKCKHHRTNLTEIVLHECLFEKTQVSDVTAMFTNFDAVNFIDGEFSSRKTQKCSFMNCQFLRFNILPTTVLENATFTGTVFDALTIRESVFSDTNFKNCVFQTVNQTRSSFERCSFPYTSLKRCTFSDNQYTRCQYDHFVVKFSNLLRNSFEGSRMDHTSFERTNFSYNNLTKGVFYNIKFTFCVTRDNCKTDAVFCNSEMLTSSQMEVVCGFKPGFKSTDAYQYRIKLLSANGGALVLPDQVVTVSHGAPSATFLVSYDLLNMATMIQIEKTSNTTFGNIFNYSASNEEIINHIRIDDKMYMHGKKRINGKEYIGFIANKSTRGVRSKSL